MNIQYPPYHTIKLPIRYSVSDADCCARFKFRRRHGYLQMLYGGTRNSCRAASPLTTFRVFSLKTGVEPITKSYCHLYGAQSYD
ncbi:hypothetical protein TNCV_4770941 [Trichonephila clavipes]|nr:hypothetical protein TNCV_4770941 [Trichonephila clavipes]